MLANTKVYFLFILCGITCSSCKVLCKTVDSIAIDEYFNYTQTLNSHEFDKALKKARKVFKKGLEVDSTILHEQCPKCPGLVQKHISEEEALTAYCLFNGTDYIVGQVVVLYLDQHRKVSKLELRSWGR